MVRTVVNRVHKVCYLQCASACFVVCMRLLLHGCLFFWSVFSVRVCVVCFIRACVVAGGGVHEPWIHVLAQLLRRGVCRVVCGLLRFVWVVICCMSTVCSVHRAVSPTVCRAVLAHRFGHSCFWRQARSVIVSAVAVVWFDVAFVLCGHAALTFAFWALICCTPPQLFAIVFFARCRSKQRRPWVWLSWVITLLRVISFAVFDVFHFVVFCAITRRISLLLLFPGIAQVWCWFANDHPRVVFCSFIHILIIIFCVCLQFNECVQYPEKIVICVLKPMPKVSVVFLLLCAFVSVLCVCLSVCVFFVAVIFRRCSCSSVLRCCLLKCVIRFGASNFCFQHRCINYWSLTVSSKRVDRNSIDGNISDCLFTCNDSILLCRLWCLNKIA